MWCAYIFSIIFFFYSINNLLSLCYCVTLFPTYTLCLFLSLSLSLSLHYRVIPDDAAELNCTRLADLWALILMLYFFSLALIVVAVYVFIHIFPIYCCSFVHSALCFFQIISGTWNSQQWKQYQKRVECSSAEDLYLCFLKRNDLTNYSSARSLLIRSQINQLNHTTWTTTMSFVAKFTKPDGYNNNNNKTRRSYKTIWIDRAKETMFARTIAHILFFFAFVFSFLFWRGELKKPTEIVSHKNIPGFELWCKTWFVVYPYTNQ